MELTIIVIVIVVAIVAVAAVSQRIAVTVPLSLVVTGIALSFLPGLPRIEVNPRWILAGALPPLLYATAVRMPAHDFRRDFKAITWLAVLLVVLTTICSGLLFDALLPGLGLASALALGAIISPTDAVAATSVGRRLGLPSRLLTGFSLRGGGGGGGGRRLDRGAPQRADQVVAEGPRPEHGRVLRGPVPGLGPGRGIGRLRCPGRGGDRAGNRSPESWPAGGLRSDHRDGELGNGGLPAGKRHFPAHGPAAQDAA